jgi:hypothetical protein
LKGEKMTGLKDIDGAEIQDGDFVSLDGNMTADNSMGSLPNGWTFEEDDVYQVYFDERIKNWSLRMDVEPNTAYNVKYLNHAVSLLHDGRTKIQNTKPCKKE